MSRPPRYFRRRCQAPLINRLPLRGLANLSKIERHINIVILTGGQLQVIGRYLASVSHDDCAFHPAFELADVARPAMVFNGGNGALVKRCLWRRCPAWRRNAQEMPWRELWHRRSCPEGGIWIVISLTCNTDPRETDCPFICCSRFWWVAQIIRTSTGISLRPPMRSTRSCRNRRSLACSSSGRSPISSRKSVPPSAYSIFPGLLIAGESALLVAEEFAFQQVFRYGRTVDGNQFLVGPGAQFAVPWRNALYRCRWHPAAGSLYW